MPEVRQTTTTKKKGSKRTFAHYLQHSEHVSFVCNVRINFTVCTKDTTVTNLHIKDENCHGYLDQVKNGCVWHVINNSSGDLCTLFAKEHFIPLYFKSG